MNIVNFTPWTALAGGILIGIATSLLWIANGRIAGMTGLIAGVLSPVRGDTAWRAAFLVGLFAVGAVASLLLPSTVAFALPRSVPAMIVAGVLVGVGTRIGNGCTSGHGVCGLSRFSLRSLVATVTFIGAGIVTTTILRVAFGGAV